MGTLELCSTPSSLVIMYVRVIKMDTFTCVSQFARINNLFSGSLVVLTIMYLFKVP